MNKFSQYWVSFIVIGVCISFAAGCSCPLNAAQKGKSFGEAQDITDSMSDQTSYSYPIVHTALTTLFTANTIDNSIEEGDAFFGQDGHYINNYPSYTNNDDGTITDNITGLMWQQTMNEKMTVQEAQEYAEVCTLAGYEDWRIPTIKELFSLIDYNGHSGGETAHILYINTAYFNQPTGDTTKGEREIDAQTWSATKYVSTTMNNDETYFGVNFIDGRIKGYPTYNRRKREEHKMYFRLVRGNPQYGINNFVKNNDGTITDLSTGLMWQITDDGTTKDWEEALLYTQNLTLAEYNDWRLPTAKELQSIVDYTRSPKTSNSPAIFENFQLTSIIDEKGSTNWGYYWSGTTHQDGPNPYDSAAYISFGEALGKMHNQILDVHGAGAVRSDPKSGIATNYPKYVGPQGDLRRVYNFVLAVRTIKINK